MKISKIDKFQHQLSNNLIQSLNCYLSYLCDRGDFAIYIEEWPDFRILQKCLIYHPHNKVKIDFNEINKNQE